MPERSAYAPGVPCWVDLSADDPDAAAAFYSAVLGWEVAPGDERHGGYRTCHVGGKSVAALGPKQQAGVPAAWLTYLATDDADAAAAKAREAGGQVLLEPGEVGDFGRLAILADPAGAAFGLWQAREMAGAELVNEPGAVVWNHLTSTDPQAAGAFYEQVLGVGTTEMPVDGEPMIALIVGDEPVAGISLAPEDVPSHWAVNFAVPDCEAAASTAAEHGASVVRAPSDFQFGRHAMLIDPEGALFGIVEMAPDGG